MSIALIQAASAGRYVYHVEQRAGRGRNFTRAIMATFETSEEATAYAMARQSQPNQGHARFAVTKQWQAA